MNGAYVVFDAPWLPADCNSDHDWVWFSQNPHRRLRLRRPRCAEATGAYNVPLLAPGVLFQQMVFVLKVGDQCRIRVPLTIRLCFFGMEPDTDHQVEMMVKEAVRSHRGPILFPAGTKKTADG